MRTLTHLFPSTLIRLSNQTRMKRLRSIPLFNKTKIKFYHKQLEHTCFTKTIRCERSPGREHSPPSPSLYTHKVLQPNKKYSDCVLLYSSTKKMKWLRSNQTQNRMVSLSNTRSGTTPFYLTLRTLRATPSKCHIKMSYNLKKSIFYMTRTPTKYYAPTVKP